MRLVFKVSLKPPNGMPLVQSCLEILPVSMESYTGADMLENYLMPQLQQDMDTDFIFNKMDTPALPLPVYVLPPSHGGCLDWTGGTITWPPRSPYLTPQYLSKEKPT